MSQKSSNFATSNDKNNEHMKKEVKSADKVYGVKAIIDCNESRIDKQELFNYLKARSLRCVWKDPNTIVEYEEESADVECYWTELGKKYSYTLVKHVKLIDYVPNFEKIFARWQESSKCDEDTAYDKKTKPRQGTIYDKVFSTLTYQTA